MEFQKLNGLKQVHTSKPDEFYEKQLCAELQELMLLVLAFHCLYSQSQHMSKWFTNLALRANTSMRT